MLWEEENCKVELTEANAISSLQQSIAPMTKQTTTSASIYFFIEIIMLVPNISRIELSSAGCADVQHYGVAYHPKAHSEQQGGRKMPQ